LPVGQSQQPGKAVAKRKPEISDSQFVAVRIEHPSVAPCPSSHDVRCLEHLKQARAHGLAQYAWAHGLVLRVQHARGHVLEFGSWPPDGGDDCGIVGEDAMLRPDRNIASVDDTWVCRSLIAALARSSI
jgi:hypothetical protein